MWGMNARTGKPLGGFAHLEQSIRDILLTPLGTRVMLRDYGSDLFRLVDRNLDPSTVLAIQAATIGALQKWEPRLQVVSVTVAPSDLPAGHFEIDLVANYLPDGQQIRLSGIVL